MSKEYHLGNDSNLKAAADDLDLSGPVELVVLSVKERAFDYSIELLMRSC